MALPLNPSVLLRLLIAIFVPRYAKMNPTKRKTMHHVHPEDTTTTKMTTTMLWGPGLFVFRVFRLPLSGRKNQRPPHVKGPSDR